MSQFRHNHLSSPIVPEYNQRGIDQDVLFTYISLDDYDAMIEARHCRGAVDNNLVTTGGMVSATFPMTLPSQAEPISIRESNQDPMTRQIPTYTPSSYHHFLVSQIKLP